MLKTLMSVVLGFLIFSSTANATIGTTEQKMNFVKRVILEELPGHLILVSGSISFKAQIFNVVAGFSDVFIPGEGDYLYAKFRAVSNDGTPSSGWVRFVTDSTWADRDREKFIVDHMYDMYRDENFVIAISKPVNLNLKELK